LKNLRNSRVRAARNLHYRSTNSRPDKQKVSMTATFAGTA
jgi:hypothetical protein